MMINEFIPLFFLGGETVKNLQQQTGAKIVVEKYAQQVSEQPIIITGNFMNINFFVMKILFLCSLLGPDEAVQQAQQLVQDLLNNVK
jgi:hypothetical protein